MLNAVKVKHLVFPIKLLHRTYGQAYVRLVVEFYFTALLRQLLFQRSERFDAYISSLCLNQEICEGEMFRFKR